VSTPDLHHRGAFYPVEQRRFSGRHPYLAAACQTLEQGGAAQGIEVCGNLVEKK
jgi:hypothetical protein